MVFSWRFFWEKKVFKKCSYFVLRIIWNMRVWECNLLIGAWYASLKCMRRIMQCVFVKVLWGKGVEFGVHPGWRCCYQWCYFPISSLAYLVYFFPMTVSSRMSFGSLLFSIFTMWPNQAGWVLLTVVSYRPKFIVYSMSPPAPNNAP